MNNFRNIARNGLIFRKEIRNFLRIYTILIIIEILQRIAVSRFFTVIILVLTIN